MSNWSRQSGASSVKDCLGVADRTDNGGTFDADYLGRTHWTSSRIPYTGTKLSVFHFRLSWWPSLQDVSHISLTWWFRSHDGGKHPLTTEELWFPLRAVLLLSQRWCFRFCCFCFSPDQSFDDAQVSWSGQLFIMPRCCLFFWFCFAFLFSLWCAPLDYVLVLQQQSVFCSFFHQDEEFVTPLINWQFAACNSVLSWSTWRKLRGDGHKKNIYLAFSSRASYAGYDFAFPCAQWQSLTLGCFCLPPLRGLHPLISCTIKDLIMSLDRWCDCYRFWLIPTVTEDPPKNTWENAERRPWFLLLYMDSLPFHPHNISVLSLLRYF